VAVEAGSRAVALRIVLGVLGGYALGCSATIWVSYVVPTDRADAVLTGLLISFAVYAAAILWAFAARTLRHAALGLVAPALAFGILAWLAGPQGAP